MELVWRPIPSTSLNDDLNDGKGKLSQSFQISDSSRTPYAIEAGDLNRDGRPDIVIGYIGASSAVFFNDGSGKQFTRGSLWRWPGRCVRVRAG